MARALLFGLLLVVAAAAAVLSFSALRDLALVCGFVPELAWLLPVIVDAGAAAGSLVWLGGTVVEAARRFARSLALCLLGLSVAANALGHGLEAFRLAPAWWVVVIVSAIAPAVLGAVVHLAVLVGRAAAVEVVEEPISDQAYDTGEVDERGLSRVWDDAPFAPEPERTPLLSGHASTRGHDRATDLIAAGVGRRRLARELGISEYEARRLINRTRTTPSAPSTSRSSVPTLNGVSS
jgi:hypothetical protein